MTGRLNHSRFIQRRGKEYESIREGRQRGLRGAEWQPASKLRRICIKCQEIEQQVGKFCADCAAGRK